MNSCFIITSTINTAHTKFNNAERLQQTIKTIESIREKVPDAKILLIDNSIDKTGVDALTSLVDYYYSYVPDVFSKLVNIIGNNKGMAEVIQVDRAINKIRELGWTVDHLFKISGRYVLSDSFNINEYDDITDKLCFYARPWMFNEQGQEFQKMFFETRLIYISGNKIDFFKELLVDVLNFMLTTRETIEVAYMSLLSEEHVILKQMHVEGYIATGDFIKD